MDDKGEYTPQKSGKGSTGGRNLPWKLARLEIGNIPTVKRGKSHAEPLRGREAESLKHKRTKR